MRNESRIDGKAENEFKAGLSQLLAAKGLGPVDVARAFNVSETWARKRLELDTVFSFKWWHFEILGKLVGNVELAMLLVRKLGVQVIPNPSQDQVNKTDLLQATAHLMRETAEAISELSESLPHGITGGEAKKIDGQLDDVVRQVNQIRALVASSVIVPPISVIKGSAR